MKVGIIGSGNVGQALALGFEKHGWDVAIGSRNPAKLDEWQASSGFAGRTGTFAEAAGFGDIIVLATKGISALESLRLAGFESLSGKVIIDATNPIDEVPPQNGVIKFFTDAGESLMERLQEAVPEAHFVKAFNSVGAHLMVNPDFGGIKPTMFICGNDAGSKQKVAEILDKFGWEVEDAGMANAAGALESLCILWCIPGFLRNDWAHAFKLLKLS